MIMILSFHKSRHRQTTNIHIYYTALSVFFSTVQTVFTLDLQLPLLASGLDFSVAYSNRTDRNLFVAEQWFSMCDHHLLHPLLCAVQLLVRDSLNTEKQLLHNRSLTTERLDLYKFAGVKD